MIFKCFMSKNQFRIGRTGRAGTKGESFTFVTRSGGDVWKVMGVVEVMEKAGQVVPPNIQQLVEQQLSRQQVQEIFIIVYRSNLI